MRRVSSDTTTVRSAGTPAAPMALAVSFVAPFVVFGVVLLLGGREAAVAVSKRANEARAAASEGAAGGALI